jgi:hypothetical protein
MVNKILLIKIKVLIKLSENYAHYYLICKLYGLDLIWRPSGD